MYKTASGSLVPDGGPLVFQGYDEQGPLEIPQRQKSSKGTKVLASAGEMAVREGNDFYLGSGGGYVISAQSPVGKTCQSTVQQDCCPYASRTRSTTTTWSSICQQCARSKVCEWTEVVKRKRTKKTKLWRNGTGTVINLLVQRSCLPESCLLLAWIDRRR